MEKLSNSQLNKMTKLQLKEVVRDYEGTIHALHKELGDLKTQLDDMTDSHINTNTEDAKEIQRLRGKISELQNSLASYKASYEEVKEKLKYMNNVQDSNEELLRENSSLMTERDNARNILAKYKLISYLAIIAFIIAICFLIF